MSNNTLQSTLNGIRIVMIQTSHTGNIGAAARAMKVMGLSELYLVKYNVCKYSCYSKNCVVVHYMASRRTRYAAIDKKKIHQRDEEDQERKR